MSLWDANLTYPYSGWLTTQLLEDSFSQHYTAADVAKLLPEEQYWNTDFGTKDFDPANISGIYHYLNLMATLGEFPASSPAVGLMIEWFIFSGEEFEYGNERLQSQIQYLSESLGPVTTFLDSLPDGPSTPLKESDTWVVRLDPTDERLRDSNEGGTDLVSLVATGKLVEVTDTSGKIWYAQLHGSIFRPFIKVSDTPEEASMPLSQKDLAQGIAYRSLDDVTGYSVEPNAEVSVVSPMPALDFDLITHLLLTGEIVPVDLETSEVEKLIAILKESNNGRAIIFSNVILFGAALSDEDISWMLSDRDWADQFINLYSQGWNRFVPPETVLTILRDKDFGPSVVGRNPDIFVPLLTTPDDLSWLLRVKTVQSGFYGNIVLGGARISLLKVY